MHEWARSNPDSLGNPPHRHTGARSNANYRPVADYYPNFDSRSRADIHPRAHADCHIDPCIHFHSNVRTGDG